MPAPTSRSRSTGLPPIRPVTVDAGFEAPPEIIRFQSRGRGSGSSGDDYYKALSAAAAMRLRLLGTLHARSELAGPAVRESAKVRLAAQQRQAWQQLQWLMAEMKRIDELSGQG